MSEKVEGSEKKEDFEEKLKNAEDKIEKLEKQAGTSLKRPPEWKNEGIALVLAIVIGIFGINGIGQIYVGRIGRGVKILVGSIILFVSGIFTIAIFGIGFLLLIIYFVVFIWQILDARKLCVEYNQYLETNGERPW